MSKDETIEKRITNVPFVILMFLTIPISLLRAWVVVLIYRWYVPVDWPDITLKATVGLMIIINICTKTGPNKKDMDEKEDPWQDLWWVIGTSVFGILMTLGFARVVLFFI
jgi:hypothetical protein